MPDDTTALLIRDPELVRTLTLDSSINESESSTNWSIIIGIIIFIILTSLILYFAFGNKTKEPKAGKPPKEPKAGKPPKEPKAGKPPKEPKASKQPK